MSDIWSFSAGTTTSTGGRPPIALVCGSTCCGTTIVGEMNTSSVRVFKVSTDNQNRLKAVSFNDGPWLVDVFDNVSIESHLGKRVVEITLGALTWRFRAEEIELYPSISILK